MADTIERTIYKLEIDDSGYIRGVENMSASTSRFTEVQQASNRALQILETALKEQSQELLQAKRNLDAYTGSDEKYRQTLTRTFNEQKANNDKLVGLVAQARKEYELATKAAQDFANTSARANNLQSQPGQRIAPQPTQAAGLNAQIFNTIDLTDMAELAEITAQTKTEFDELADSIQLAEQRLKQLDPASEEFKQLAPIVEQGKKALQEYGNATQQAAGSQGSLRTQIRLGREELVRLEQAGKGATKEYFELEKRVAKLTDAFNDQQARIRILASDTKLLDFGKGAITAATSAFQAYTAVSILAGDQSEELQKKTMQLFAAMQLLQSLEQLSNLTRREGVLATLAQSGAQSAYTAVIGASTGALRAFRLALAATGIGAVIVGIAILVTKLQEAAAAAERAGAEQRILNEINEEAIKTFTAEVVHLGLIRDKLNDLNIPQKERIRLAKDYNKTAEEGNKIDLKQIDNIALVNIAIDTQIKKIEQRARARAAESILVTRFENLFLAQEQARVKALEQQQADIQAGNIILPDGKAIENNFFARLELEKEVLKKVANDPKVKEAQREVDLALRAAGSQISITDLIVPDTPKDTKGIENVFAQRLRDLQAKLAEVTAKSFESEGTIRKQFQASLEKEIATLNELVKDKKLTSGQAAILIELTTRINEVQLNEALDQFNKKVTDARNKLNEELRTLQQQNTEESIQLLQDEFERRSQLIEFNEQQALQDAQRNTDERLAALEEQRDLVGEQAYQDAKNRIVQIGEDAQTNIVLQASQDRQQLAQDSFKKSLEFFQNAINEIDLIDDQDSAQKIRALSNQFLSQKITFEQFQKDLEKIEKDYAAKKRNRDLLILQGELDSLDSKIRTTEDKTSAHYKELLRLRDKLAADIAAKESEDAVKDVTDTQTDDSTKQVSTINDYVSAVGQLADSVIQFWQRANEAEAAALDRSISLQEKRVDAATRIAQRGNVEYLKAETDRLKELEVARENAARRQLGIDAALQASQILVGITGAIAKIATPGIGIAETIASIAVIVGALATGYGLVKNLQGNQPRLFKGTTEVKRTTEPAGRDTIPAWLTEGEAVVPRETNKKYKKSVEAIYHGKVPADVLNEFVENYVTNKSIQTEVNKKSTVENKEVNTYQSFIENIKRVPQKVIDTFIEKHYSEKINRYSTEVLRKLFEKQVVEKKESLKNDLTENFKTVSTEQLNRFVDTHHRIKPIPQPNYQRIKEAAEVSVSHDGKMAVLLSEQNKMIQENTDVQRAVLRALKTNKIDVHYDANGLAVHQMEIIDKIKRDQKT